jgi:DNA-directed RNA polymerase subunit L
MLNSFVLENPEISSIVNLTSSHLGMSMHKLKEAVLTVLDTAVTVSENSSLRTLSNPLTRKAAKELSTKIRNNVGDAVFDEYEKKHVHQNLQTEFSHKPKAQCAIDQASKFLDIFSAANTAASALGLVVPPITVATTLLQAATILPTAGLKAASETINVLKTFRAFKNAVQNKLMSPEQIKAEAGIKFDKTEHVAEDNKSITIQFKGDDDTAQSAVGDVAEKVGHKLQSYCQKNELNLEVDKENGTITITRSDGDAFASKGHESLRGKDSQSNQILDRVAEVNTDKIMRDVYQDHSEDKAAKIDHDSVTSSRMES